MFRWMIGSSLQFRFLVLGVAAALVVFGALQVKQMPVDVFPEFAPPVVEVQTEAIGLSAEEVESLITLNLEELLSGVPWLTSIRSQSVTGLSSIVLTFKRGTDIMKARQMIQERLTLAYTLPNVAQPPVILQPLSATSRFMMIGISSDKIDATELSLLARWTMKPRLVGVPGVANVAIWGQRLRQLHVQIDPESPARSQGHAGRHHRRRRRRAVGVAADVPQGLGARHRRLDRQSQSAPRRAALDADRVARGHGEGRRVADESAADAARRCSWARSPR